MFRHVKESFIVIYILLAYAVYSNMLANYFSFIKSKQCLLKDDNEVYLPNTGMEILPKDSRLVLDAIRFLKLTDFRLIGQLEHLNLEIVQRIHEGAWPIKHEPTSRFLIGYKNEMAIIKSIKIIYTNEYVCVGVI